MERPEPNHFERVRVGSPGADADREDRDAAIRAAALRAAALRAANTRHRGGSRLSWLWEWAKVFPAAVLLFLGLRSFLVEAYKIPSGSMERTLLVGDFLLVNKLVYGAEVPFSGKRTPALRTPERGDVVVFEFPLDPSQNFVKRLVGLPGDTLSMHDGVLVLNGEDQAEAYVVRTEPDVDPLNEEFRWQRGYLTNTAVAAAIPEPTRQLSTTTLGGYRPSRNNWGPLVVPAKHLFVLGDNRDNSRDSRYWGFVPDSLVRGTPLLVYYSFRPDSGVTVPWLTRIRWARLGRIVE